MADITDLCMKHGESLARIEQRTKKIEIDLRQFNDSIQAMLDRLSKAEANIAANEVMQVGASRFQDEMEAWRKEVDGSLREEKGRVKGMVSMLKDIVMIVTLLSTLVMAYTSLKSVPHQPVQAIPTSQTTK